MFQNQGIVFNVIRISNYLCIQNGKMSFVVFYLLFFGLLLFFARGINKKLTVPLSFALLLFFFLVKITSSFFIYYIYTHYYPDRHTADIFKYYDDSVMLYDNLFQSHPWEYVKLLVGYKSHDSVTFHALQKTHYWYKPWEFSVYNDNRTVIRLNMLLLMISAKCYHIHTLFMCFVSFSGLLLIYEVFCSYFRKFKHMIAFAVFCVPSVVFWSSANSKESMLIGCFGIFIFTFNKLLFSSFREFKFLYLFIILLVSGYLLFLIKPYSILIAIPSLIAWIIIQKIPNSKPFNIFLIVHVFSLLIVFEIHHLIPGFDFTQNITFKNIDFIHVANETNAGSKITIPQLDGTTFSIIKNSPIAFVTNFMRPYPSDCNSPFLWIAFIENSLILVLIVSSVFCCFKHKIQSPLLFFSLFFTLILGLTIGLIVPVLGAAVRYKVPYLPFFIPTLLICIRLYLLERNKTSSLNTNVSKPLNPIK